MEANYKISQCRIFTGSNAISSFLIFYYFVVLEIKPKTMGMVNKSSALGDYRIIFTHINSFKFSFQTNSALDSTIIPNLQMKTIDKA